jgi:hypothetical protein
MRQPNNAVALNQNNFPLKLVLLSLLLLLLLLCRLCFAVCAQNARDWLVVFFRISLERSGVVEQRERDAGARQARQQLHAKRRRWRQHAAAYVVAVL